MKIKIVALLATGLLLMSLVGPAFAAPAAKTMFCHHTGNTVYTIVDVSGGAVDTHMNYDGDWEITGADGFTTDDCPTA